MASEHDMSSKSLTSKMTALTRDQWQSFVPLFKAYSHKRKTNIVINETRSAYVTRLLATDGSHLTSTQLEEIYDGKNADLAYDLLWALQNCPQAVNILADDKYTGQGREGFLELERIAYGCKGDSAKAAVLTIYSGENSQPNRSIRSNHICTQIHKFDV